MTNQSDLLLSLFDRLRQACEPNDGNEIALVDNFALMAIRIRRGRHSDPDFPSFRLKIWRNAAGINLVLRQEGEGAGPNQRSRVRPDSPDVVEEVTAKVKELVTEERRRLIEYKR